MALDQETLKNRAAAGRLLRGLTQEELGTLFEQDGLGKHDPGRIERGTKAMQSAHKRAFVHHLRLPERWFEDPDTDSLIATAPPPTVDEVVAATLRRLGVRARRELPGRIGHLGEAEPTTDEDRQGEEPPRAEDSQ